MTEQIRMSKVYVCDVIQDPDDPEGLAIQFSDELFADTGWKVGDVITWTEVDGGWSLTKKSSEESAPEA
jgi:hypothetical protein